MVKAFFAARSGRVSAGSRHVPSAAPPSPPSFRQPDRRAVVASDDEVRSNPRARSAKLRFAVRTDALWRDTASRPITAVV